MEKMHEKFEDIVQLLFKLYAPGQTYKIVEEYEPFGTRVVQVLEVPENHESFFSSVDIEYQFWTIAELIKSTGNAYDDFVFRKLADKVIYSCGYSKSVAYSLAVMYALITGRRKNWDDGTQTAYVQKYLEDSE
jgi:hypothetical protein